MFAGGGWEGVWVTPDSWVLELELLNVKAGKTNNKGKLGTVDLLIKEACFAKNEKNIFNINSNLSKLVSARRSTVLCLPTQ